MGNGRLNKEFISATPSIKHDEIRNLISKYPKFKKGGEKQSKASNLTNEYFILGLSHLSKKEGAGSIDSKVLKKCLHALTANIDRQKRQNPKFYNEMFTKLVTQDIRQAEISKIIDLLKELEETAPVNLKTHFDYRMNDIQE